MIPQVVVQTSERALDDLRFAQSRALLVLVLLELEPVAWVSCHLKDSLGPGRPLQSIVVEEGERLKRLVDVRSSPFPGALYCLVLFEGVLAIKGTVGPLDMDDFDRPVFDRLLQRRGQQLLLQEAFLGTLVEPLPTFGQPPVGLAAECGDPPQVSLVANDLYLRAETGVDADPFGLCPTSELISGGGGAGDGKSDAHFGYSPRRSSMIAVDRFNELRLRYSLKLC